MNHSCADTKETSLPKEIIGATREQLESIGFKFGDDVDALFVKCQQPDGWTIHQTGYNGRSILFDDNARKRAVMSCFANLRGYPHARILFCRRYSIEQCRNGDTDNTYVCTVTDCGVNFWEAGEWDIGDHTTRDMLTATCHSWLDRWFPDWKNPMAYW